MPLVAYQMPQKAALRMNAAIRCAILFVYCLFGGPTFAAEQKMPFKCESPFDRKSSHEKLAATFGAANAIIKYDGERDADVTILFPDDPKRTLKIEWRNAKARRGLGWVRIAGPSSWSVAGLSIGTPLAEVERMNGGPFKLNYFEGDYGGDITDWLGGRLDKPLPGGCVLGASVGIDEEHLPADIAREMDKEVSADRSLLSSGAGLRSARPLVSQLIVSFPQ